MTRPAQARLLLTQHSLNDLSEIYEYSKKQWGIKVAETYLDELDAGLDRIQQQPDLLQPLFDLPTSLTCYRVNKHFVVCDIHEHSIVVLTVIHGRMDLPGRIAEILPLLREEVELLHKTLRKTGKSDSGRPKKKRK